MYSAVPESWIRGLEVFNELLDVAPNGVAGNVGIDCPGEEEPFVEELIERVELGWIWCDFGRRERLEHVVEISWRRKNVSATSRRSGSLSSSADSTAYAWLENVWVTDVRRA